MPRAAWMGQLVALAFMAQTLHHGVVLRMAYWGTSRPTSYRAVSSSPQVHRLDDFAIVPRWILSEEFSEALKPALLPLVVRVLRIRLAICVHSRRDVLIASARCESPGSPAGQEGGRLRRGGPDPRGGRGGSGW